MAASTLWRSRRSVSTVVGDCRRSSEGAASKGVLVHGEGENCGRLGEAAVSGDSSGLRLPSARMRNSGEIGLCTPAAIGLRTTRASTRAGARCAALVWSLSGERDSCAVARADPVPVPVLSVFACGALSVARQHMRRRPPGHRHRAMARHSAAQSATAEAARAGETRPSLAGTALGGGATDLAPRHTLVTPSSSAMAELSRTSARAPKPPARKASSRAAVVISAALTSRCDAAAPREVAEPRARTCAPRESSTSTSRRSAGAVKGPVSTSSVPGRLSLTRVRNRTPRVSATPRLWSSHDVAAVTRPP